MSVEFITPDVVSVNGYIVEIRDSRDPDYFDDLADAENKPIQERYAGPIRDIDIDLRQSWLPIMGTPPELVAYQQIPRFIDLAAKGAREQAVSYRDFKVGASAYAISASGLLAAYLFGANYKPSREADKYCAELDVLNKAQRRGLDRIVALAIYGPADFGDVNMLQSLTLHPCDQCRNMLDASPLLTDDTLIITANEKGDIELMLKTDLIELHRQEQT